jgi:hypothetical protein
VAIWRSAEVEAVLGGSLDSDGLSEAVLQRLIDTETSEREQIEFKGQRYNKAEAGKDGWTAEQEFAKDVSALANHRGGVLFLGVTEKAGIAHSLTPLTSTTAEKEEQRLRSALANHMTPLGVADFVPIPIAAGGFALAVVVPPSLRAPHAVVTKIGTDNRRPLRYPVRHGTDTRWLEESEVAERYVRRLRAGELEATHLATVVRYGMDALQLAENIWLYVAIVPEIATIERIDRQTIFANQQWLEDQAVETPLSEAIFANLRAMAAPGRTVIGRQFDGTDPAMKPDDVHLELHADGSAFVATAIALHTADPETGGEARAVGLQTLTRDAIPLIELAGRWVTHQAAVPGTARLQAGLFDASGTDGRFDEPVELQSVNGVGQIRRVPNTRRLTDVAPTTETVYDLTGRLTTRGAVAVASVVIDGLLQWFGLADCPFLARDGSIRLGPWQRDWQQAVQKWAAKHDVPIV